MIKRLLMTTDTVGGVWHYSLALVEALADYGVEVALATMGQPLSTSQQRAVRRLSNIQVYESHYRLEWMHNCWDDVEQAGCWLRNLAKRFGPDLVHLNNYAHGGLFAQPTLIVAHSDVLSWWQAVKGHPAPAQWRRYREVVAAGLFGVDYLVAPTYAVYADIQHHFAPTCAGSVIPNGIRLPTTRNRFIPHPRLPVILAVGRVWDEAKNITALCDIAPNLKSPIYVAGSAAHPDGEEVRMRNVYRLGVLAPGDLAHWYRRAAIYALPAYYEPFGLTVLEAAAAGCALVLGDIPSLRENWDDAALFVPPADTSALQAALTQLIENPALRQTYSHRAHQRAHRFSLQQQVQQYANLYRQMEGVQVAH